MMCIYHWMVDDLLSVQMFKDVLDLVSREGYFTFSGTHVGDGDLDNI